MNPSPAVMQQIHLMHWVQKTAMDWVRRKALRQQPQLYPAHCLPLVSLHLMWHRCQRLPCQGSGLWVGGRAGRLALWLPLWLLLAAGLLEAVC